MEAAASRVRAKIQTEVEQNISKYTNEERRSQQRQYNNTVQQEQRRRRWRWREFGRSRSDLIAPGMYVCDENNRNALASTLECSRLKTM